MKKVYFITIISILLASCSIKRAPIKAKPTNSSTKFNTLSNEGTLCLQRVSKNTLKAIYLPLNSTCKSSSRYNWNLNDIELKQNGSNIAIETYSLYKKSNSQMATADCAGAGVRVKTIKTATSSLNIKWGNTNITTLNRIGKKNCFRRIGKQVVKLKSIK